MYNNEIEYMVAVIRFSFETNVNTEVPMLFFWDKKKAWHI